MKTVEEIQDEYARLYDCDDWNDWTCGGSQISNNDVKEVATRYAQQYKERILELEDALKCMLSLSMAQGASKEWFEVVEANRLLNKQLIKESTE